MTSLLLANNQLKIFLTKILQNELLRIITLILLVTYTYQVFMTSVYSDTCSDARWYLYKLLFTKKEMGTLQHLIDHKKVTVDIPNGIFVLPLLIDITPRTPDLSLQFTPRGWQGIVGWRNWPYPSMKPTPYKLIMNSEEVPGNCMIEYKTHQSYFLKCKK